MSWLKGSLMNRKLENVKGRLTHQKRLMDDLNRLVAQLRREVAELGCKSDFRKHSWAELDRRISRLETLGANKVKPEEGE